MVKFISFALALYLSNKIKRMSIEVQNITKKYNNQLAVNNISFTAKKGEIVGFLGPNGAGKSTTMKIITGFIPPSSGTVLINGVNVAENPMQTKAQIGYLPEHNPLYLEMYIKEYLLFVARIFDVENKTQRVNELIELVGLTPEKHKKIGQLSKGYRQRVGLAQALMQNPEVLILDEPTTGLDPNQILEIRNLIKKEGANKTVLMSTHIMQEVEAICDKVIIINKGQIVANESIANLKKQAGQSQLEVEFEKPINEQQLKTEFSQIQSIQNLGGPKYRFQLSAQANLNAKLFQFAEANQNSIISIQQSTKNLESIFKELTQS